jgi:hypothetical protein
MDVEDMVMAQLRHYSNICLQILRKIAQTLSGKKES